MPSRRPLPALALVMPRPELPPGSSPCTPRANTPSTPVLFPKQIMPSPRTSMESWSSSGHPDEEVQWEWKSEQVSLLTRTLEALPGHLYTPFNGAVPPSNLLDRIAKSVAQAQGPLEWPHSIRQTRFKLIEIARGLNKENVHTTIDEADEEESRMGHATSTPMTRRPLSRRAKEKNSATVSRLSTRLQRMDRLIPMYHPYARPGSRSPSPPASRLKESYLFPPIAAVSSNAGMAMRTRSSLKTAFPPLRRSLSTLSNPPSDVSMASSSGSGSKPIPVKRSDSFTAAPIPPPSGMKRAPSYGSLSSGSLIDVEVAKDKDNKEEELLGRELNMVSLKGKRPRRSSATSSSGGSSSPERKKKRHVEEGGKEKLKEKATATKVKVKPKAKLATATTTIPSAPPSPSSTTISTRTRTRSSSSVLKPTVSSAAKQAPSNADPNCAISTRTRVPRSPKLSTSAPSPTTSPKSSSESRSRSKSPRVQPNEASASASVPLTETVLHSPTPVPERVSGTKSAPSTLAYRAKSTRTRITRSNSMFGAELPSPQAPVVLPTSTTKSKF